ncbi:hypothetical protein SLA2020_268530 [Shorea laevis]
MLLFSATKVHTVNLASKASFIPTEARHFCTTSINPFKVKGDADHLVLRVQLGQHMTLRVTSSGNSQVWRGPNLNREKVLHCLHFSA